LYDPLTETWATTGSMTRARFGHTAFVLSNEKVLVTSGENYASNLNTTELHDPSTDTWSITGNMNTARSEHTASLLTNGKVFVTGGYGNSGALNSTELYSSFQTN
jgi:N-acetylneuraminic acid mutarotase